jgi:nucleoside-diphosphate-sugar epimerase/protoporphyrinogen oxidase
MKRAVLWSLLLFGVLSGTYMFLFEQRSDKSAHTRYKPSIVIVGGGVTGLCAARRLEELGYGDSYVVLERNESTGGLASSHVDEQRFVWDLGVHVLFSHFEFFDRLLDEAIPEKAWLHHVRRSPAFMRGAFVGYPVQDNLAGFPRDEALRIIANLNATRADRHRCAQQTGRVTFDVWMHLCFGDELTASFGRPYNYKVWAYPAERMNSLWVGERVATIDVDDVVRRFEKGEQRTGWGPNALFRYPVHGTGAIWRAVADGLPSERMHTNTTVTSVSLAQRRLTLSDGTMMHYDQLITAMPMDRLATLVNHEIPSQLRATLSNRSSAFLRQTCNLVGFGLQCPMPPSLDGVHWIYFPEEEFPFYRITVLSNLSPEMVPNFEGGQWSILTESSESPMRQVDVANHTNAVLASLQRAGLIPSDCTIVSTWEHRLDYGYPVPYDVRDSHVHAFDEFLLKHNVRSRGRFGAWKYEVANQDHSCEQGVEAVDNILFGSPEVTFRKPNHVNQMYTAHEPPHVSQLFGAESFPLELHAKWTIVIARCNESFVDEWLETLVRSVVPDDVRFQVILYEMCQTPPATQSLRDRALHVVRLATPKHVNTEDLAFASHIRHTYIEAPTIVTSAQRAQHSDWTLFVPASALRRVGVWLRCGDLLASLQRRQPTFGILADEPVLLPVKVSEKACAAIKTMSNFLNCPPIVATCWAPGQVFYASRLRLLQSKMPGDLVTQHWLPRDWQTLWALLLGEPAAMPLTSCVPSVLSVTGEFDEDAAPQEEECPSVGKVNSLLDQVVPRVANARSTLLITGALGNIGLSLLRRLLHVPYVVPNGSDGHHQRGNDSYSAIESWRVIAVDIRDESYIPTDLRPHLKSRRLVFKKVDISDYAAFSRLLASSEAANVRGVVHLAAVSRVADCQANTTRCLAVNTRGTEHVVRAIQSAFRNHLTAPWLLFTSSREVFGDTHDDIVDESSVQNPQNVYGASKAFAETYVRKAVEHGYRSLVVRLSNVYGSWEDNQHRVVPNFMCRALANMTLQIVGGNQNLNLIHIDDILRGIELAMQRADAFPPGEEMHVAHLAADGEPISIGDLAKLVVAHVNSSSNITVLANDPISVDNFNTNTDGAELLLHWHATIAVEEGIAKFAASYPFGALKCPLLRPDAVAQVSVPAPAPIPSATSTTATTSPSTASPANGTSALQS